MRRILILAIKVFVTAALLYFALRKVDFAELLSRIDAASFGWLLLAILLAYVATCASALRWRTICTSCDTPIAVSRAFRFTMIGAFFNQTLPSSMGGDAIRLWLLARGGAGWRAATYSIFVDRAFGLLALAILILATLPWSYELITDPVGRSALVTIDVLALGAGFGFLLFGGLRIGWFKRLWFLHHIHASAVVANRMIFNRTTGPRVAALSILIHVLTVVIAWCAVRSIAAPATFLQVLQIVPPVIIVTMIPISIAGWGLREASMGLAFSYAGLSANEGINVSLLFGIVFFIVGATGGLFWLSSAESATHGKAGDVTK
ncbi:flippase-like domain-containing protein [Rhodopseudomonas boonkerdii]|uniref:lysylphosphatidylglycerol synthase transmembrane domain-containing protein n=1 Tax=Rhodopseudomonas boonkerdii TaxID=475937 RepID=UPI001E35EC73|nr:lysylphosphatidylglycerol synthase transmembrane domain-containing protein [Rhodopseudomonas boonkerdii]UGV25892.1 flippase-like domain-containing protein [Rhodopseudomonas boonkerdii]